MEIDSLIKDIISHPELHCKKEIGVAKLLKEQMNDDRYIYDEQEALRVIAFFETLKQYQVEFAGQYVTLTNIERFWIFAIFGLTYKDTGKLVHTDIFLFIAKKNGKTLFGSGLILYFLLHINGCQVYSVATSYQQAEIAFRNVVYFIQAHDILSQLLEEGKLKINEKEQTIRYTPTLSIFKCVSEVNVRTMQGFLPSFILYDEVGSYKNYDIITKLDSAKPDGCISLHITTAEKNKENPAFWMYQRAELLFSKKERNLKTIENFLPIIYELDEEDDVLDETKYIKANPNLGFTTVTLRKLIEERDNVFGESGDEKLKASFLAYRLNRWTRESTQGIKTEEWDIAKNNAKEFKDYLTDEKLKNYFCWAGVDLSKNDDYTAYTLCFYISEIGKFYFKHRFYIPAETMQQKEKRDNPDLVVWKGKYVFPTYGGGPLNAIVNYEYLKTDLADDMTKYNIVGLSIDSASGGSDFARELTAEFPKLNISLFDQGWKHLCPANRYYIDTLKSGNVIDGNPVMEWMASCVRFVYGEHNNLYFEKINFKDSPQRIDGIDTSVMALSTLRAECDLKMVDADRDKKSILNFFDLKY